MKYWKSGDAEQLGNWSKAMTMEEMKVYKSLIIKMWEERDNNMTKKVKEYLNDSENTYFVVVGAGHMFGDTGIITQLEKEGIYEITQIK